MDPIIDNISPRYIIFLYFRFNIVISIIRVKNGANVPSIVAFAIVVNFTAV